MSELRRIQFVTRYFQYLQGLRVLPLGLGLLAVGLWMALPDTPGLAELLEFERLPLLLALTLPVLGLYSLAGLYYRRTYGFVQQNSTTRRRVMRALGAVCILGAVVGLLQRSEPGWAPTEAFLVMLSVSCAWCWVHSGFQVHHHVIASVVLLILAGLHGLELSPVRVLLQGLPFTSAAHHDEVTLFSAWGLTLSTLGVMDHRLLAAYMRPVPDTDATPEPGVAG